MIRVEPVHSVELHCGAGGWAFERENREAIGRSFDFNPELAEALSGELAVESDILAPINYIKPEHMFLTSAKRAQAVEYYVPVFDGRMEQELAPLRASKDTIHLRYSQPIPYDLVARVAAALARRPTVKAT